MDPIGLRVQLPPSYPSPSPSKSISKAASSIYAASSSVTSVSTLIRSAPITSSLSSYAPGLLDYSYYASSSPYLVSSVIWGVFYPLFRPQGPRTAADCHALSLPGPQLPS